MTQQKTSPALNTLFFLLLQAVFPFECRLHFIFYDYQPTTPHNHSIFLKTSLMLKKQKKMLVTRVDHFP